MQTNFEFFLVIAVIATGLAWLLDFILFQQKSKLALIRSPQASANKNTVIESDKSSKLVWLRTQLCSFFPVLLLVLLIRSFIFEPYTVVSGSLKPTLLVGDYTIVNKFTYGLRLPILHTQFLQISEPKVGDIALFRWPRDPSKNFIKRVIGVPGDYIRYVNKVLYVNNKPAIQAPQGQAVDSENDVTEWPVIIKRETINNVTHNIYQRSDIPAENFDVVVPKGQYFMMGDNRDGSYDSRGWGFVPEENLVGKGSFVLFSWDGVNHRLRWDRLGKVII